VFGEVMQFNQLHEILSSIPRWLQQCWQNLSS